MTTPKIPTVHENDSRLYLWEDEKHPGVTSVVGMLPKPGLQFWAAKKAAEAAIEKGTVTERDKNFLQTAHMRDRDNAADIGSNIHDLVDRKINGEELTLDNDEASFMDGFDQFVERFSPHWLHTEETVFGRYEEFTYAGSFDAIATIDNSNWLIDFKTTRSGVHPEVALQLSAYMNASRIIHPDGSSEPIPEIDHCGDLWLRPDQWSFQELKPTQIMGGMGDDFWHQFGALLKTWHWENGGGRKKALGMIHASGATFNEPF